MYNISTLPAIPTDGIKVIEARRSTRGNERLEFWREFTRTADRAWLPALTSHALIYASNEIGAHS